MINLLTCSTHSPESVYCLQGCSACNMSTDHLVPAWKYHRPNCVAFSNIFCLDERINLYTRGKYFMLHHLKYKTGQIFRIKSWIFSVSVLFKGDLRLIWSSWKGLEWEREAGVSEGVPCTEPTRPTSCWYWSVLRPLEEDTALSCWAVTDASVKPQWVCSGLGGAVRKPSQPHWWVT